MAFGEGLTCRLREIFEDEPSITEKKMFGGVSFIHRGDMAFSEEEAFGQEIRRATKHPLESPRI